MSKSLGTKEWKKLLRVLRNARLSADMTQAQLAEILERPQSFVAKVEGGERRLDVIEFRHWAKAVGMSSQELIGMLDHK